MLSARKPPGAAGVLAMPRHLVVDADLRARAAEEDVGAAVVAGQVGERGAHEPVGTLVGRVEAEEVARAAEDVVLAEAAEDRRRCRRCPRGSPRRRSRASVEPGRRRAAGEVADQRVAGPTQPSGVREAPTWMAARVVVDPALVRAVDAAVALHDVVAQLAEDEVVRLAAGEVVVAPRAGPLAAGVGRDVVEEVRDVVLGPPRRAVGVAVRPRRAVDEQEARVVLGRARWQSVAQVASAASEDVAAAVEERAAERLEAAARPVAERAVEPDGVAEDDVVGLVAVDHVVAGAADEHVAAESAEDDVVGALVEVDAADAEHADARRAGPVSAVVWIFCRRASGSFGSATSWSIAPWSPKTMSS